MKFHKIASVCFSILIGFILVTSLFAQSDNTKRGADYVLISDTSGKLFLYDIRTGILDTYAEFTFPSCPGYESVGNFDIQYLDYEHLIIANWECGAIYKFNLRTKVTSLISKNAFIRPIGIAVSKKKGGIYYVADQERGILAYNARDGSVEIVLEGWNPDGISLDPQGRIYFTRGDDYIYRVSSDGLAEEVRHMSSHKLNGIVCTSQSTTLVASMDSFGGPHGAIISTFRDFQYSYLHYYEPPLDCPQVWLRDPEDVAFDRNSDFIYIIDSDYQNSNIVPGLYRLRVGVNSCLEVLHQGPPLVDPVDILLYSIRGRR